MYNWQANSFKANSCKSSHRNTEWHSKRKFASLKWSTRTKSHCHIYLVWPIQMARKLWAKTLALKYRSPTVYVSYTAFGGYRENSNRARTLFTGSRHFDNPHQILLCVLVVKINKKLLIFEKYDCIHGKWIENKVG